ncbi:MAG: HEAT repeat domain-containing protein [Acidobacteria bacterium]|nr:HEAT repeat domain-containing protein [Acidobacteriota bacterium]
MELLLRIVLWTLRGVLAVDLCLVAAILTRRFSRWLYYRRKDEAVRRFGSVIEQLVAGKIKIEQAVASLGDTHSKAAEDAVQWLLLERLNNGGRAEVTETLFRLGFIDDWAAQAFGSRRGRQLIAHIAEGASLAGCGERQFRRLRRLRIFSVRRAQAVTRLGALNAPYARVFLREALMDPSPMVARANIAAMGDNREACGLELLLELLRQVVEGKSELPLHSVKTAVIRSDPWELGPFTSFLKDPDARVRFVLVDAIREIAERSARALTASDFPAPLCRWFLEEGVQDESRDVRARSARVIRHFHSPAASRALSRLLLDEDEFVRLHAVRACADAYYGGLMGELVSRVRDPRWRVREAAVKALAAMGTPGRERLENYFLEASDRYACEQLVEEMQRAGMIAKMLPALGQNTPEAARAESVCGKMVGLGRNALLSEVVLQEGGRFADAVRARLLEILMLAPNPEFLQALHSLGERQDDRLSAKAQSALKKMAGSAPPPAAGNRAAHA